MTNTKHGADVVVALAGNSNVGKSVVFHRITGIGVIASNYPGTTVELTEGRVKRGKHDIRVVDLPGIYSLGAVAKDELVARRMILEEKPDVIVDIVDASNLERNLYLTLQLLELNYPIVVILNQYDLALSKGIKIDPKALSKKLGVPVIPTVATRGENISKAFDKAVKIGIKHQRPRKTIRMGKDLEESVASLARIVKRKLGPLTKKLPSRTIAIKLLEGDIDIINAVAKQPEGDTVLEKARGLAAKIREKHDEATSFRIARERHGIANLIANEVTDWKVVKPAFSERLSGWMTDTKTGVPIMIGVFACLLLLLFYVGGFLEELLVGGWDQYVAPGLGSFFQTISPNAGVAQVLDIGINLGIEGILAVMIPYILVFFLVFAILEDSGYLPRMAFVMDSAMHKIGLHGRSVVPMLGGFGCNVPAIMGTRVLTTRRERLISGFLITMVPCSARTAVILGTVGFFVGIPYALVIYGIVLALIFIVGWVLNRMLSGQTPGMIMEMPPLRKPAPRPVLSKTWLRMRRFVFIAAPLLLIGSLLIAALQVSGAMDSIVEPLSPITVGLLGLPAVTIIPLLYGFIRKEGALALLVTIAGTSSLGGFMTHLQFFVFALVVTIYVPCIATIAVLGRELGWRYAILISICTFLLALVVGGLFYHLNPLGL